MSSQPQKISARKRLTLKQGVTNLFKMVCQQDLYVVVPITGITRSCRATVTVPAHNLPGSPYWVFIRGVEGMKGINHAAEDLDASIGDVYKAYRGHVVDTDNIQIDKDTLDFPVYVAGGELAYRPPVDFTGCTARMQIRETTDSAVVLLEITTTVGANGSILRLGGVTGVVEIDISAIDATAFVAESAVFDIEVIPAGGYPINRAVSGTIKLSPEVTREV